jgi:hypothetical protein
MEIVHNFTFALVSDAGSFIGNSDKPSVSGANHFNKRLLKKQPLSGLYIMGLIIYQFAGGGWPARK